MAARCKNERSGRGLCRPEVTAAAIMQLCVNQIPEFVNAVLSNQTEDFHELNSKSIIVGWQNLMASGAGVAYGAVADGIPTGFLLGVHTIDIMTGLRKAFEYLWVVSPQYRAGGTGLKLLREFEAGAALDGCAETVIGCNSAIRPESLRRWYGRLGYKSVSESFRKGI